MLFSSVFTTLVGRARNPSVSTSSQGERGGDEVRGKTSQLIFLKAHFFLNYRWYCCIFFDLGTY